MTQRTPSKRRPRQDPSAPTLKQRAADLRASMPARGSKASAPPSPQVAPDPDAVLVAAAADLQRLEAAIAAILSTPGRSLDEAPGYADLDAEAERVTGVLAGTPAVGLPGLQAKAKAILCDRFSVQSPEELEMAHSLARDVLSASPAVFPPRARARRVEEPDPAFALIDAHHAAYSTWDAAYDATVGNRHPSDPGLNEARRATIPLSHAEEQAFMALVGSLPTSLSGLMALADYLPGALTLRGANEADDEAALALGAICASIRALVAKGKVTDATGSTPTDWHKPPPGFMASPAIEPTHFALIPHALRVELDRLHCIAQREFDRQVRPDTAPQRRERLRRILKLDVFEAASLSGDAQILALGVQLDEVHARWRASLPGYKHAQASITWAENDAKARGASTWDASETARNEPGVREAISLFEDIASDLDSVCEAIWNTPARTPLGLAVKARAAIVQAFTCGEYEEGQGLGDNEDLPYKPIRSLIEACCAFAGVDWKGELTDGTTLAVPSADPAERPSIAIAGQINFASATLNELVAVHDTAKLVGDVAQAVVWQGRCKAATAEKPYAPSYNAAGALMVWLSDELTHVEHLAIQEMKKRLPTDYWNRERRLAWIAAPVIQNGDVTETATFIGELAALLADAAKG